MAGLLVFAGGGTVGRRAPSRPTTAGRGGRGVAGGVVLLVGFFPGALGFGGNDQASLALAQSLFDRLGEAGADAGACLQAVDHHVDGVPHLAVEGGGVREIHNPAIDAGPQVALFQQVFKQVAVFPLLALDEGGENEETGPLGQTQQRFEDLFGGLGGDGAVALGAESLADAGEKNAQVVVDLGDGSDGAAGVPTAGFLLDRDRGRQPGEEVDLGLGHLPEELAGVTGK